MKNIPPHIAKILARGEGVSTEFKLCKDTCPKNVFETICAMLNRIGGDIFLGVADNGEITGMDKRAVASVKMAIISTANNPDKISPPITLTVDDYEITEREYILHVIVPDSGELHRCNGRIYDRNDSGDFDITSIKQSMTNMVIRKSKVYTENEVYPYMDMGDLRIDLIERVRKIATIRYPYHPWGAMTPEEIVKSAGMYQKDMNTGKYGFTLAAALMFGKDETINSVVPHHRTDAIMRRRNLDRYDDRDDIRTNLLESYDRLGAFIAKHLDETFHMEGNVRINVRDKLFREIIANLLIHREFLNSFPAKLIIETNHVRTENASIANGYGEMDLQTFIPKAKNPNIARVFKEIGWAEELGSGFRNMVKYGNIYTCHTPILVEGDIFKTDTELMSYGDSNDWCVGETEERYGVDYGFDDDMGAGMSDISVKVSDISVDMNDISVSVTDKSVSVTDKIVDMSGKSVGVTDIVVNLIKHKESVLSYLSENEFITNAKVCQLLGTSQETAKRLLRAMVAHGLLCAHGENKGRKYTKA